MKEPILSREEVGALWTELSGRPFVEGSLADSFSKRLEAVVLERICGEPIYQVWIEETSSYADVTAEYYGERLPSNRRIIYAINRSKS